MDLHKKNPDIRIWREKNKPEIRICQSGTDMQTIGKTTPSWNIAAKYGVLNIVRISAQGNYID